MKRLLRILSVVLAVLIFMCSLLPVYAKSPADNRTEHETSIHIDRAENAIPSKQSGEGPPGEGPPGEGPPGEGPPSGDQGGDNPPPENQPDSSQPGGNSSTTTTKPPATQPSNDQQGGDNVDSSSAAAAVIIIAIIVVVIGTVIALVVLNNRKNQNTFQAPPIPPAPPAPPVQSAPPASPNLPPKRFPQAVITGAKGVMANKTFSINGNLLIGRNAQKCNVAYPIDTQGISAVHCQIRETNGGFEIIDRGSSNGTFLGSGQRLVPNVPTFLPDGTFFYLGSAEQLFQIKY